MQNKFKFKVLLPKNNKTKKGSKKVTIKRSRRKIDDKDEPSEKQT